MDFEERKSVWHSSAGQHSDLPARTLSSLSNSNSTSTANVEPRLIDDLHEFLPLLQSFLDQDRKLSSSFTRRGTMVYTKTPVREPFSKKPSEQKGKITAQSMPTKKRRDPNGKDQAKSPSNVQDRDADSFSVFSTRTSSMDMHTEELNSLREQVEDLQRKLLEKEELLNSAEISKKEMNSLHSKYDELKHQTAERDSLLKSTQLQLSDAKIKLADRQATLEKIQWEAMTSNKKVEKLQGDIDSMQGEISAFMPLIDGLAKNDDTPYAEDYDITPYQMSFVPEIDSMDEMEIQRMEAASKAYIDAVAVAKEKQDEESMVAAATARLRLQSLLLRTETVNLGSAISSLDGQYGY